MEKVISRMFPCAHCNRTTQHFFQKQHELTHMKKGKMVHVKYSCKTHHEDTLGHEMTILKGVWLQILKGEFK